VRPAYADAARGTAEAPLHRGIGLVYGGGDVGLMGAVADAVLRGGGEVIGVIPEALVTREVAHLEVTDLRVVGSMHERKALMADLADGFVALPGGLGTFEELCEILTWSQLGLHTKPCGVLDVAGFWGPFLALLDHAVDEGFVLPDHRRLLLDDDDPARLLDRLEAFRPVDVDKWLDRPQQA
jgi:uncharacterized protein (TIGR00730 family)